MGLLAKLTGRATAPGPRARKARPTSLYRGVLIVAGDEGCCRPARILAGQRFLTDEIPKLPLDQCDVSECRCSYKLFDDRRTGERRLSDFGFDIISDLRIHDNQRSCGGDRRVKPGDETPLLTRIASALR